jgi:APA family basic amino acid/polyamine antiporter
MSNSNSPKIGLLPVISLVIASQVGSGAFMLPAQLAPLGSLALGGWVVSAIGAILLALIFGKLCMHIPRAGGPHVYVNEAFGKTAAFFTGWSYWVIAWTSSVVVITAAVSYLTPIFGKTSKLTNLTLEIVIFAILTLLNFRGAVFIGIIEVILTIFKCIPLIFIPIAGFYFFDINNFTPFNPTVLPHLDLVNKATLLTFWAFMGLESATANANIIENPEKTVPLAVIYGTMGVAILYILNNISIIGLLSNNVLMESVAPYVDATNAIFGAGWDIVIAIIAFLALIGTLNAWILTGGQIAYAAAKDGLFPSFFAKTNQYNAPYVSLTLAFIGTIPLLFMTINDNLVQQVNTIVDAAVTALLGVYVICMLSFIKLYYTTNKVYSVIAIIAMSFCLWVIAYSSWLNISIGILIVLSGIPIFIFHKKK